ncbi:MAG: protein kinase [Acidobacteria bacterium]|nr:protein kinase [Acidobacteriota bacterium]
MTPERFQQIEELYHAVRERTAEEREALLAQTDTELRGEIESLLALRAGGEFLDRPAIQNTPQLLEDSAPAEAAVRLNLGPYRIESKLGEGGMGEVFLAVDTRLGRCVAIKTTREQFSARFAREARALSLLNHPHICTLHDVGPNYLVMELVEGETIAARLKSGPFPLKTALLYASQIIAALVEAHGKGILHRDLKPGNIMIAKAGVKVLDFGLAKFGHEETVTASRVVMGTPAYMAPEQREGKPTDARSDIYSFGCVLYEMLTGVRLASQQRRIPSRDLERIVSRCLETDPELRWQSAVELERRLAGVTAAGSYVKSVLVAATAVLSLSAAAYVYFHRVPKLTEKDTIVLADFDNKTGDPVFDDTLRQGLAVELQQSPFAVMSDQKVQMELVLMGQSKQARLNSDIAQQICVRTASAAVLEGSIARIGSQYVLGLRARDCYKGTILGQSQAVSANREDVLGSLSQMTRKFRTSVGESLATVEKQSPLPEGTTPSLDALKAYSMGWKATMSAGYEASIPLFERAVELDSQFAMAQAHLGLGYSAVGESQRAVESTTKAWLLRNRVSERERFFIHFTYDRQVTGNLEKAYQTLELWLQAYPRRGDTPRPHGLFGGIVTHGTGRFEKAIAAAQQSIDVEPATVTGYSNLSTSYFLTGRFREAERILDRAAERKAGMPIFLVLRYSIAALKDDQEQMDHVVSQARGTRGTEHWVAHTEALALARSGRLKNAARSSNRAVDLALQEKKGREPAARYRAARAVWEAVWGNSAEAKRSITAALELSNGRDVQYAAGLALAFSGDSARSEALASDLEKRFPEDTFVKFTYVPVLRASGELSRGKPADSVERLQIAHRYELASTGLNFPYVVLGGLHSAFVRGEALAASRRYAEAAAEFKKILDHRGIVGLDPIGALALLHLGRAYRLSGDIVKAKSAYDEFFMLLKDADPDLPVILQAKAEYARLQ